MKINTCSETRFITYIEVTATQKGADCMLGILYLPLLCFIIIFGSYFALDKKERKNIGRISSCKSM